MLGEVSKLVRISESAGIGDSFGQERSDFLGERGKEGSVEKARGNGVDPDTLGGQVPG